MKERADYRNMKQRGAKIKKETGTDDIMDTLNKWVREETLPCRYSAMKGLRKQGRRGVKRMHE